MMQQSPTVNQPDLSPLVNLRVPGQWRDIDHFLEQLPVEGQWQDPWLRLDDLPKVVLDWKPADNEFPAVFEISCRRPPLLDEMDRVKSYTYNACVQSVGGSATAARDLIRVGAALIRSGGAGVFIDNGAISHGAVDWLDLDKHCHEPLAVFYAFVNITHTAKGYASYGMHIVGQQDGFIACDPRASEDTSSAALRTLEDFLRQAAKEQRQWKEGDVYSNEQGQRYLLKPHPHVPWLKEHNPMWNPYGRWELASRE